MIPLYAHQRALISTDPMKLLIAQGTGSGKTITALMLARGETLVICPKQQKLDRTWENNLSKLERTLPITVVSKEEFRRDWKNYQHYQTVIVDEVHTFSSGVLPDTRQRKGVIIPKTSQLFDALTDYLKLYPPQRLYLLSATPASKPMAVYALATILGKTWDFFKFREKYYLQRKMGYHTIWLPKGTMELKQRLADNIKKMGVVGKLSDFFDVPPQNYKTVYVDLTNEQKRALAVLKDVEADPMARRAKQRTIENGIIYDTVVVETSKGDVMKRGTTYFTTEKIPYILERAQEFPKMLIFANYIGQVEAIYNALKEEGYNVLTLTGQTKDRGPVVSTAEASDACIVIAQCGVSSGYELKSFSCVVFASKSYRYLDYEQGKGRVLRADALKKNLYIHLVTKGGCDDECHKAIMQGQDFQERIMKS